VCVCVGGACESPGRKGRKQGGREESAKRPLRTGLDTSTRPRVHWHTAPLPVVEQGESNWGHWGGEEGSMHKWEADVEENAERALRSVQQGCGEWAGAFGGGVWKAGSMARRGVVLVVVVWVWKFAG